MTVREWKYHLGAAVQVCDPLNTLHDGNLIDRKGTVIERFHDMNRELYCIRFTNGDEDTLQAHELAHATPSWFYVLKDTDYLQAKGVRFCLHVGTTAYCFFHTFKKRALCCRVELFTPKRRFRVSWARW